MLAWLASAGAIVVLTGIIAVTAAIWQEVAPDPAKAGPHIPFAEWVLRGLAIPLIWLFLFNSGLFPGIPPITLGPAPSHPGTWPWIAALPDRLASVSITLASYWALASYAWILHSLIQQVRTHELFQSRWILCLILSLPVSGLILFSGGMFLSGFALTIPAAALAYGLLPLRELIPTAPLYSRAQGHIKMGRYLAAEEAVLNELEICPDDYQGWMLLAQLYANHFNDVSLAEQTIHELCDQPQLSGIQVSLALHQLADWHLQINEDPDAARKSLQSVVDRLPQTHFARMAQQRLRQLPASREDLQDRKKPRSISLPALSDPLDKRPEIERPSPTSRQAAAQRANLLSARLKQNPNDPEPREELARILTEKLDRAEQGMEQIQQLLEMPDRPEQRVPEWLSLLAAWQLGPNGNRDMARRHLNTLIEQYPESPQARVARRRLHLLDLGRKSPLRTGA